MNSCLRGCSAYGDITSGNNGGRRLGDIQTSANLSSVEILPVAGEGGLLYSFTVANFSDVADSAPVDGDVLYYFVVLDETTNRTAFQRIVREQIVWLVRVVMAWWS